MNQTRHVPQPLPTVYHVPQPLIMDTRHLIVSGFQDPFAPFPRPFSRTDLQHDIHHMQGGELTMHWGLGGLMM